MRKLIFTILMVLAANVCFGAVAETFVVAPQETISGLLANDFTGEEINRLYKELRAEMPSFVLRVGMEYQKGDGAVSLLVSPEREVQFYRQDDIATVSVLNHTVDVLPTVISGTINTSLYQAILDSGEDPELAATIARIYEWEFDFFRDLRVGDTYKILVEKQFVRGKYYGYGRILAGELIVRGKSYKAYYFNDGKKYAYYNDKGQALERGFLRVPLSYTRISSVFTSARRHPVLGGVRAHYGVDYAAPTGTPIMATASGTIKTMTYNKASGNFVEIQHANGYQTYYLHMSRFNRGLKSGSQVSQGQVIGYVGSTGYSTGPHLDYRIKRNGSWLNPANFIAEAPTLDTAAKEELTTVINSRDTKLFRQEQYAGIYKPTLIP